MSLRNKFVAAVLAALATPAGMAGISDLAQKTEPTRVESMARIPKKPSSASTFTCWQEGRQIFQTKSVRHAEMKQASIELAAGDRAISLMDMKNGFCIYERHGASADKDAK